MKLIGSSKSKITKDKNGEIIPLLEITGVVLLHGSFVKNYYQHDSRVLHPFISNKSFGQLLDVSTKSFTFLKTFDSEFSFLEVLFTGQNSKPLEREDKVTITLVIS